MPLSSLTGGDWSRRARCVKEPRNMVKDEVWAYPAYDHLTSHRLFFCLGSWWLNYGWDVLSWMLFRRCEACPGVGRGGGRWGQGGSVGLFTWWAVNLTCSPHLTHGTLMVKVRAVQHVLRLIWPLLVSLWPADLNDLYSCKPVTTWPQWPVLL